MTKTAQARLHTPAMYTECPHCEYDFDLFDTEDCYETANSDDGQPLAWWLFDQWHSDKKGTLDITCPTCEKEFTIEEVVY